MMRFTQRRARAIEVVEEIGSPASVSGAEVGALCARSAVMGAYLDVPGLTDKDAAAAYLERGRDLQDAAIAREAVILELVDERF